MSIKNFFHLIITVFVTISLLVSCTGQEHQSDVYYEGSKYEIEEIDWIISIPEEQHVFSNIEDYSPNYLNQLTPKKYVVRYGEEAGNTSIYFLENKPSEDDFVNTLANYYKKIGFVYKDTINPHNEYFVSNTKIGNINFTKLKMEINPNNKLIEIPSDKFYMQAYCGSYKNRTVLIINEAFDESTMEKLNMTLNLVEYNN